MLKRGIYIISLAGAITLAGCGGDNIKVEEKVKYVKVQKVKSYQDRDKLIFNGKIKEKSLTSLSFRVGGPLVNLNVNTGDYVNKGQVIAVIDKRDYKLQVQSTKAQYTQLEGEYERYKELYNKNKIPANSFEKIESGYLMAKTAYENAVNQLNDTELKAPAAGYIHEKFTENFQTVGPGQPIVSIINLSKLEVVISVPENQLLAIRSCRNTYLDVKNANVSKLPVTVLSVADKAKSDGLYEVKFSFKNNKSMNIFPGMSAEITMNFDNNDNITLIPSSSVFRKDKGSYVWVYNAESKSITKRRIEIKQIAQDGFVEITSGLKSDEQIVTAGTHYLYENQIVKPIVKASETNIGRLL
jgi:RND family efflux transporter MFP subunit